jgi:hypothetical protein
MKKWNIFFFCVVIAAYVILISLFYSFDREYFSSVGTNFNNCTHRHTTCISFCEDSDFEKFTDDIIKKNFSIEEFYYYDGRFKTDNESNSFEIIKNRIECEITLDKIVVVDDFKEMRILGVR